MARLETGKSSLGAAVGGVLLLFVGATLAEPIQDIPLWGDRLEKNPIRYEDPDRVREPKAPEGSPSGRNRVFSRVETPTYSIHRPPSELANGVGLVICPGGGYVDVWLDREGHDLGIWLARRGVTSLVLKYRTNARGEGESAPGRYDWETYLPAVAADGREAIRIMRSQADDLGIHPQRIGIAGFSAGGHLAFTVGFDSRFQGKRQPIGGQPNFVGLFYPWLWDGFQDVARAAESIPPTFIMNGAPDPVTPASLAVELYQILLEREVSSELHVFARGAHGFDLGDGRGESAALWKVSFVAWLQDQGWTR